MFSKKNNVAKIFSEVSTNYDIMNDIMSLGMHHIWKNIFVNKIKEFENMKIIDIACGTGDVFYKIKNKFPNTSLIIGCDPNIDMLNICKDKMIDKGFHNPLLVCCEAEHMPFNKNIFNIYTISFGIRNVYDIQKSLSEAYRIMEKGGQFLCMEFGIPDNNVVSNLYDLYSHSIPIVGKLIADNKDAYKYLIDSIRTFPQNDQFISLIKEAGFQDVERHPLLKGIVNIFIAWK